MHPTRKTVSRIRLVASCLTLAVLMGTLNMTAAYAGTYTQHGSICSFYSNTQSGSTNAQLGIYADRAATVTCPIMRLDREDNRISRLEVDYASGSGGAFRCRMFAISDVGEVEFGPALEDQSTPNDYSWLTFRDVWGSTPIAQHAWSTYALECTMPQGASIFGLIVTE